MTYEYDEQAADEAACHALTAEQLDTLRDAVTAKRAQLGIGGVTKQLWSTP